MNKILAASIRALNGAFAIIIILLGAGIGDATASQFGASQESGTIIGAVAGFLLALILCGLLALFIEMRTELIKIRILLSEPENANLRNQ